MIVGDQSPTKTGQAIAELGDDRIRYWNRSVRGPYPEDQKEFWCVKASQPLNDAVSLARGRWIAPMADDDAVHPDHAATLLENARSKHVEVSYGFMNCMLTTGQQFELGTFPPQLAHFGFQAAIYHSGLRFFRQELVDAQFGLPADWSMARRMLRVGVSFGMVDKAVVDYNSDHAEPWTALDENGRDALAPSSFD